MNKIVIAIDGFSSCGKSTFAKMIAQKLGYLYIDSGAMYRAFTLALLRNNAIAGGLVDESKLQMSLQTLQIGFHYNRKIKAYETTLDGVSVENEIRSPGVSNTVSIVAAIASVRERMVARQQELGSEKGIVMDGRDIGTVVFPKAELKIFMVADPLIRAQRRFDELKDKNKSLTLQQVLQNVNERDRLDQNREISPLTQAPDAVVLDNSHMTLAEQMRWFNQLIDSKFR